MNKPVGYFVNDIHSGWQKVAKEYESDPNVTPLYTAPPKKEWVGLTEEEVEQLADGCCPQIYWKAIEAKLKEKNAA